MAVVSDNRFTFQNTWDLIKPHADPLLIPVREALDVVGVPLIPLIQKVSALVTPHFKLAAWLCLLASACPHLLILVAAVWFVGEAGCRHRFGYVPFTLARINNERENIEQTKRQTKLESFSSYFNGETLHLTSEYTTNLATIKELEGKEAKRQELIETAEAAATQQDEDRRSSLGVVAHLIHQIRLFTGQATLETNEELRELKEGLVNDIGPKIQRDITMLTGRNSVIEARLESIKPEETSSTPESQALLFLITFIAVKILPAIFIYPALIGVGILLGNHLYCWVKRPPENHVGDDYVVVIQQRAEEL